MPFISEAASAIKSRFGFHNPSESVRATPDVSNKSSFRDNLSQYSAIRSINDRDESRDCNNNRGSELVVRSFELIEDPSFWKDHNVQVIIRLRPLSSSEISQQGHSRCVRQESHQTVTWTGHPETRFTFDLVADETISQEKLFNVAGVPMVENCVNGYNSCMFAYGQTGSGKTHTMLGDIEGGTRRHSVNCGMTPRVFEHLFSRIQKEKEARREEKMRFTCKCSFLEIYNEQILDLLNPSSCNLQLREDLKKGVYVENLTEMEVSSARDVMQQLLEGAVNRKVAATNMNHASSRSHSVFTCVIESSWESQGVTHHRFARLNLVDLAGSERQKSSGAEGERLKEATNINKSLSTLGLVIMNLVSISNGKSLHVPYRDSKLTFLLQDSLGGNSKTIIIANISPANSCSLETLSTLKFAQRAKFIKNNAIVNEDASGDVIAMRMQIQQLKKEVSHLRSLAGGASVQDGDSMSMGLLGSPGAFKWEGLNGGAFSPLTSDKRVSQKKEYEAALIGAFRREKDKDISLQALTAENQAVMQLAKQREDEIKGLKMRLRFRESGIKRLEAVASGKISAETHLLQEKEELLKEIEVMRTQVSKKQELTRFAMENLRLNEEIRRLKSFYEEGERERMSEQIMILENKLLEALDWKLMNESHCTTPKEKTSTGQSAINEENEFLRLQAIHKQGEIDLLRKKLDSCLDEKQKLERQMKTMEAEIEVVKSSQAAEEGNPVPQLNHTSADVHSVSLADQMELKAMVDAIAAASQREAEAHEMAITLSRENDELRSRVKVLIEDNNKLIDLYERAVTEINNKTNVPSAEDCETRIQDDSTVIGEKELDAEKLRDLEHQLIEMHEENEKLMGLYEKAMQERISPMVIDLHEQTVTETNSYGADTISDEKDAFMKKIQDMEHQLLELHEENERLMSLYETAMQERDEFKKIISSGVCREQLSSEEVDRAREAETVECEGLDRTISSGETDIEMDIDGGSSVLIKLDEVREKLSNSTQCATEFGLLEKAILEVDEIIRETEGTSKEIQANQQDLKSLNAKALDLQDRSALIDKKFSALKFSLSNFCSSTAYFEERELKARSRVDSSTAYLNQKKEELACHELQMGEIEAAQRKNEQTEVEVRSNLASAESKLEEENKKQESDKVLFAIDNVERAENPLINRSWKLGTKASELLKSEEEKTNLQNEIKQCRVKLSMIKKEAEGLKSKLKKAETEIERVSTEMQKASQTRDKMEVALNNIISEKQTLLELTENGKIQIDEMVMEYHQCVFEVHLNDEERGTLEAEMSLLLTKLERLQGDKAAILKRMIQRLNKGESCTRLLSEKMKGELEEVSLSLLEAERLLGKSC